MLPQFTYLRGMNPTDFQFVSTFVHERAGIKLGPSKLYRVLPALERVARHTGYASVEALVQGLRSQPFGALHKCVIEAMTVNETSFFRDGKPFMAFKDEILPALMERRSHTRTINIWSAACSSGQEPYSLAMILREQAPVLRGWTIRILATDLAENVLAHARAGRYSDFEVQRGLSAERLQAHFVREGTHWVVRPDLRSMIQFRPLNLVASAWPVMPRMDVVFLRNVMIYFDKATRIRILRRVHQSMQPDGYLLLGGGETILSIETDFERSSVGQGNVYQCTEHMQSHSAAV